MKNLQHTGYAVILRKIDHLVLNGIMHQVSSAFHLIEKISEKYRVSYV